MLSLVREPSEERQCLPEPGLVKVKTGAKNWMEDHSLPCCPRDGCFFDNESCATCMRRSAAHRPKPGASTGA